MSDIRPMSFGEILDGSLTLYRRNFGLFLRLAIASLIVPLSLIGYFVYFMLDRAMMAFMMMQIDPVLLIMGILVFVTYVIGNLMMQAGTIRVISDSYLDRPTTFGQVMSLGLSKVWPLFVVGLTKGILLNVLGGVLGFAMGVAAPMIASGGTGGTLIVIAGAVVGTWLCIWIAAAYGVTTQAVVLERLRSPFEAFGRSWHLTSGSRGRVVGLFIVAGLLFLVVPWFVGVIIATLVAQASAAAGMGVMIAAYVLPIILFPAISCVATLMYYDLRVRREAFDLQMLSEQLGG